MILLVFAKKSERIMSDIKTIYGGIQNGNDLIGFNFSNWKFDINTCNYKSVHIKTILKENVRENISGNE